jgi:predicted DNA-binding protein
LLTIHIPEVADERLAEFAKRAGKTKRGFVRELLLEKLDDLEDTDIAEAVLKRTREGKERTIPLRLVVGTEKPWRRARK